MTDASDSSDDGIDAAIRETDEGQEARPTARKHALSDHEASKVAAVARTTVVVLAGGVSSGKTTLLASLYERFGRGPIAGRKFAGSRTLPGFEARCRGIRPQGDGHVSGMPHTDRGAVPWLHLRVTTPQKELQELVMGDFDGETFDRVVDGKDDARSVPALRRADHVGIVVDGQSLVDPTRRALLRQRTSDLIDILTQSDVVAHPEVLAIILTKLDLVDAASDHDRMQAHDVLRGLRERLAGRAGVQAPNLTLTAAISTSEQLPIGHGVDELLDLWGRAPAIMLSPEPLPPFGHDQREWFGRFRA